MANGIDLGSAYGRIELDGSQALDTVNSLSATMRSAGAAMSAAVTLPLVGIGVAAVNSAGDFEQSMNIMAQVSGATGEQMAQMQAQALEMGAVTSFSAGEAAQAQLELAKAGLEPAEVMGALGGVMDLAAAGNLDLATAATIAANAMNAFNLPAAATTDIANMLAAAANASSVDVTDLAQGMQMAGAVFASNGQSVEDLTTALAILGNNAITGSDAGTSLKTMLMRLAAPTDDAAGAMQALGLEVFNADGSMRGFGDIVGQLEQATAGLTDQERSMALQTIFGADAIRAATILAREGVDGFDEMGAAVGKQGAATATANARMKGMNGAIEYLKGSIDSFLIGAALPFLDSMGGIVRVVADGISAIGGLPEPVRNAALAFAAVLAAAGPVMLAISGIGTVMGFILSPIGLLVIGVAALAAAWTMNFGGIQEATSAVWASIQPLLQIAQAWLGIMLPAALVWLQSAWSVAWSAIQTGTAAAWAIIQPALATMQSMLGLLPAAVGGAGAALAGFGAQMAVIGATLAAFFAPAVARLQAAFAGLPASLAPLMPKLQQLGAAFGGLMTALQPFVLLVGAALAIAANWGVNQLATVFGTLPGLLGPIIDQATATIQLITAILTEVVTAVQAVINGDWTAVWESAKTIAGEFNTFFRELFSRLGTFMGVVARNIAEPIINTLTDLGVDVDPILKGIQGTFETVWSAVGTAIQSVVDLVAKVTDAIGGFKSFLDGLNLRNPFEGIAAAGQGILDTIGKVGNQISGGGADGDPNTPLASGTSYFRGGLAQVNERGYEQVVLPAGSRVLTNGQTNNQDAGGERVININMGGVTVASPMDAQRLGNLLRDQLVMAGV